MLKDEGSVCSSSSSVCQRNQEMGCGVISLSAYRPGPRQNQTREGVMHSSPPAQKKKEEAPFFGSH
jgi:hypothetical protein